MKLTLEKNETSPKNFILLLKGKFRKIKGSFLNYLILFCIFIGILFYTTNILSTIVKIFVGVRENRTNSRIPRTALEGTESETDAGKMGEMEAESAEVMMKCNLPKLDPFDPTIVEFIKSPPDIDCATSAEYPQIFRTNFESKLIQIKRLDTHECCFKTSRGRGNSDKAMRFSKLCHTISKEVTEISPLYEFIQITCKAKPTTSTLSLENQNQTTETSFVNYTDFFGFVPLKPSAEFRIRNFETDTNTPPDDKLSVIILGLDAQSRMNFIRQMPLSYSYLMNNLSAVEMRGYTKVGDNTFPNVVPLLSGLNISELSSICWKNKRSYFDNCPFIWKDFAANGYRTSYAEDSVWMGTFNYDKRGFLTQPTDYYLNPMTYQMSKMIGHEVWGNSKLCYGPRLSFQVLLDYLVKTAVTFGNGPPKPYFQFIWANSLFHDYLNHPKLGDELFEQSLHFLNSNNFLNKTIFILVSDHGMRWGSIRSTYQGKLEERMPMAYFVFPPWFLKNNPLVKIMRANADKLTTPFDIYETLQDILHLNDGRERLSPRDAQRGISLFTKVPRGRTCRLAGIEEHWCVCNTMQTIPKELPIVGKAADFIVDVINKILINRTECAKLKLKKINSVLRKIDGEVDLGSESSLYSGTTYFGSQVTVTNSTVSPLATVQLQITLVTMPGDAVFEATVYGVALNWNLSGEISRLNLYRSSSLCVTEQFVQKFCYCVTGEVVE